MSFACRDRMELCAPEVSRQHGLNFYVNHAHTSSRLRRHNALIEAASIPKADAAVAHSIMPFFPCTGIVSASLAVSTCKGLSLYVHAPGAVEVATVNVDGDLEDLLYTAPGTCPKNPIEYVPAGKHEAELTPPVTAIKTYGDKVGANGKFPLPYDTVQNGGAYCVSPASNNPMVTVGGTFLFEGKDGTCLPPPVTAAGSPCCTIYMWQPNADGFYYDNCSMKCGLQPFPLLY